MVSFIDADSSTPGVARWDMQAAAAKRMVDFELAADSPPIDALGFSADGEYLVGLDECCTLSIWDLETRAQVLQRKTAKARCP